RWSSSSLEVATVPPTPGSEGDRAGLIAGAVDPHIEPIDRQGGAEALRPLDQRDALGLSLVDQPTGERVFRTDQAIGIDVEEPQPALVFPHQDEAVRGDRLGHAETGAERLREVCLACSEVAPQADHVARLCYRAEGTAKARRRIGIRADHDPL